jgi:DNA topoisomerase-1
MVLDISSIEAAQRFTQHPSRYTEASLVKKLEDLGIGRPSTYAPTISTIQKREYIVKEDREGFERGYTVLTLSGDKIFTSLKKEKTGYEKGKLFPTDIGTLVNNFLVDNFKDVINYNFTATLEKDFDEIATGGKEWKNVIAHFYEPFHETVLHTKKNSKRTSGEHFLGVDPKTGKNVYSKIGKYGPIVQIGESKLEEKPIFASMKHGQSIETITLEDALELFKLPRVVGSMEGNEMVVSIGRFGPYVRLDGKFYSLGKIEDPYTITAERCMEIIAEKRIADAEKEKIMSQLPKVVGTSDSNDILVNIGRFGPYITFKEKNYRLPKGTNPLEVTFEEACEIINKAPKKKK